MRARDNPFRAACLHRLRFRPQGTTWTALLDRLVRLGYRAGVTGAQGRGKTAFLLELGERLRLAGFEPVVVRLARNQERLGEPQRAALCDLDSRCVVLVDSGGALSRRGWRELERAARPGAGLVVTTHRLGRLPRLLECTTSADLLCELLEDLLPVGARPDRRRTEALFEHHRGNLRMALGELYDEWAAR